MKTLRWNSAFLSESSGNQDCTWHFCQHKYSGVVYRQQRTLNYRFYKVDTLSSSYSFVLGLSP